MAFEPRKQILRQIPPPFLLLVPEFLNDAVCSIQGLSLFAYCILHASLFKPLEGAIKRMLFSTCEAMRFNVFFKPSLLEVFEMNLTVSEYALANHWIFTPFI